MQANAQALVTNRTNRPSQDDVGMRFWVNFLEQLAMQEQEKHFRQSLTSKLDELHELQLPNSGQTGRRMNKSELGELLAGASGIRLPT
jgi:hypothetical protein